MSPAQISMVRASWRLMMKVDPLIVGGLFYDRLFYMAPQTEKMFTTSREMQAQKLIGMVNLVIMRLDRIAELTDDIRQLAIRHVQYGTRPEHYELVGKALLWTLERGLGSDWSPELAEAWTKCYTLLASIMMEAAEEFPSKKTL